jgi:hypothetical protein
MPDRRPARRSAARPAQQPAAGRAQRPAQRPARRPPARSGQGRGAQAARQAEPRPFLTPDGSPFRHAVERRSATVVVFLSRLPRAVPGLLVVCLVFAALVAPPVAGAVALFAIAALLSWLVYLSWPGVPPAGRAIRLVVLAIVLAYAVVRAAAA